jgi:hypothetical protein
VLREDTSFAWSSNIMRKIAIAAAAVAALTVPATAEDARTTRIETRPFYGATVTIEEGVRVFRPLPPHDRVIINPGGRTNLNLTSEEHRSTSHNYFYGRPGAVVAPSGDFTGAGPGYFPYGSRHIGPRGGHHAPAGGVPAGR